MLPPSTADETMPKNEQAWLKSIIDKDPSDKSWDPNIIHKIDTPLTFEFD